MIEVKQLTKKYGSFTALDQVSFHISEGTVFGFVGPNGAGKTTTMSILATLLAPTSGSAQVGGYEVTAHPKKVRQLIGYMPDFFGVYDNFKTTEYLDFYGASYGISRADRINMIPQLLELVNLQDKADAYVDSLSRGMKQRLCLARCLVHDPEVLILDEPASGLDPRARIEMREILKELKTMGKTIIISSHILPELAEMVDVIGVIENGTMVAQGSVRDIQNQFRAERVLHLRLNDRADELIAFLREHPHITRLDHDNSGIHVHFSGGDEEQVALLSELVQQQFPILSLHEEELDLEDVFLAITKGAQST